MAKPIRYQKIAAAGLALLLLVRSAGTIQTAAAPATVDQSLGESPLWIVRAVEVPGGANVRILPPLNFLNSAVQLSTINVNYIGNWDPAAHEAFEEAKGIWEKTISSPVPITIDASWEDLTKKYGDPSILGGARSISYRKNFEGSPVPDTWYSIALANKLYGADIDPGTSDIEAMFNSSFSNWDFDLSGNPNYTKYDFVSVVLHEIGHGLGFSGSMSVAGGYGSWGITGTSIPSIYDRFVVTASHQPLVIAYENPSTALAEQLQGGNIYFAGAQAIEASGNDLGPKLFAPSQWRLGSSFSHLDESAYPYSSGNALMTPALTNGEAVHVPGPLAMAILEDIGWGDAPSPVPTLTTQNYTNFLFLPVLDNAFPR